MAYRETARIRQHKSATRAHVLDSALGLIARHGFRATSMARLACQAGVATGTLYRYFPSRRDLFAQVFRRAWNTAWPTLATLPRRSKPG